MSACESILDNLRANSGVALAGRLPNVAITFLLTLKGVYHDYLEKSRGLAKNYKK